MSSTTTKSLKMRKNRRNTDLTPSEKNQIAQELLANSKNGKINRGKLNELVSSFGVHRRTLQYIWGSAKAQKASGQAIMFKSGKEGLPHKLPTQVKFDVEVLKSIPMGKRGTIRSVAREMQTSKSTVARWIKSGEIRPHSNAIKPLLTEVNKFQRLKYCLENLEAQVTAQKLKFKPMHNVVHIDEKWFFMTKQSQKVYLGEDEVEPYRACKSKRFIPKVMFMCAVSRPIYDEDGGLIFDGKIGMFPFTKIEPAKKSSKNRPAGTLETKQIDSITKEVTRAWLINKVIPAIKSKWPAGVSKHIYIQQDNAKPHIQNYDPEFRMSASSDGFHIEITCQPAMSPDTNINDLGWFRAIQSLQHQTPSKTVDELVKNVLKSFDDLSHVSLNNVFLSLQNVLIEIMKDKGFNSFKLPHMYKEGLIRQGLLPLSIEVDEDLVRATIEILREGGQINALTCGFTSLMNCLGYD